MAYDSRVFQGLPARGQGRQPQLSDEQVRAGFARKVYGTLAIQLGLTACLAAPIARASELWLQQHAELLLFSTLGFLGLAIALECCGHWLMRAHPWNLVVLAAFTSLESVSIGFVCSSYELQSVLWCFGAAASVAAALTAFACTTEVDVTGFGGYLRGTALGLFFVGLVGLFCGVPLLQLAYACGGAALFAAYLVYDTQLVIGGKHQRKRFAIDDYVPAALSIYLDVVRLFMFLLRLFGQRRQRNRR